MGSDELAAILAGIKERYECLGPLYQNTNFMLDAVVQDIPSLVAAVEAVLELHQSVDRGAGAQCKGCATHVTFTWWPCPTVEAITAALTGEEASRG